MTKNLVCCLVAGAILGLTAQSFGAGFRVSEQGAKAMGMANAFAAQADDPSALAFNPAGIAFQKGIQASIGTTAILVPQTEFTGTTKISGATQVNEKANRDMFFPPNAYFTVALESMPLSFGLGINSFFPLSKRWDVSTAFRDSIQEISIKPVNFQPTVAYRFDSLNLALAAGVDVTYAQVSLQKMPFTNFPPPAGPYTPLVELGVDGTATGLGYNFGLQWKPCKTVSFGAAYRSQVELDISGDANYVTVNPAVTGAIGLPATAKSTASTQITLPDIITLAVAYKPVDKLTLEFDAERTGWSSYKKLQIQFDGAAFAAFNSKPDYKNWEDVWAYRFGAQYAASKNIDLRAGYAFDTSPVPDSSLGPELPDADRHNYSIGLGVHDDRASLDLAYMWVHFVDRTVTNAKQSGEFKSDAHLFGVNATYRF